MKTLTVLLVLVAACNKDNPYYCEQNPDQNCSIDAGTSTGDTLTTCSGTEDCSGGTPACNDTTGVCVACTATDIGACIGTKPVCSISNSCRGCTANSECTSGACMPDGSCADAATVLYAQPSGGATTCTMSDKCSIEQAFVLASSTQRIIALDPGMYSTSGTLSTSKEITILGREATIYKAGAGNEVLSLTGGAKLSIYYATIKNGDDSTLGHGIACAGSKLTTRFVTIQENDANGISAVGCDVTIDRSTFWSNASGAIALSGAAQPFSVTNNVIYQNGSTVSALFGGVKLTYSGAPSVAQFEFNTIIDNIAKTGTGNSGGVVCGSSTFPLANNIIARNVLGTSTTAAEQKYGDCVPMTSLVQADVADLAFVNATTHPYVLKIGATSTAKDAATTASSVTVDFEGDERPQNGQKDIGADEYK